MFIIRDAEAGNEIARFSTMEEAQAELKMYEDEDKRNGEYTEGFYEIVEDEIKLKEIRQDAGLSIKQVTDMLGIPYRTWQSWELGERKCPEWVERLIAEKLQNMQSGKK